MKIIYLFLCLSLNSFFFSNSLNAKELYCLKETGFIYPEFKANNCLKDEIEISKSEYFSIKDLDREVRAKELIEIRKIHSKAMEVKSNEIRAKNNQKLNLTESELKFKSKCEKSIFGFGNQPGTAEYNSCIVKEKLKADIELKKKEKQEQERIAFEDKRKKELLERQENAKKLEIDRQKEKLAKQSYFDKNKKNKEEESQARLANLQNSSNKQINKIKNKELLIFYVDRNFSEKNSIPKISSTENYFKSLEVLDEKVLKRLLLENERIIFVSPKKFLVNSNVVEEKVISSKFVVSSRKISNNDYNRLQRELDIAGRNIMNAEQQANAADANTPAYCPPNAYNPGQFWSCLATQATGIALRSKWRNAANEFASQESYLASQLSNTPPYIDEKIYKSYDYKLTRVKAIKIISYNLVDINNDQISKKIFNINDHREFKILANVNPNDDNYSDIIKSGNSNSDIENWKKNRMSELNLDELKKNISKSDSMSKIKTSEILYALDLKTDYFDSLKNLFSNNKKSDFNDVKTYNNKDY
jgi:hypothetical protein